MSVPYEPVADILARRHLSRDEWWAAIDDRLWKREHGTPQDLSEAAGRAEVSRAAGGGHPASGSGEAGR
jgi:hypothetical protein